MSTITASTELVRHRIQKYRNKKYGAALAFVYVTAARIGEVVARNKPSDSPAHGPLGTALSIEEYQGEEMAVFRLYIQKRGAPRYRNVPVPLDSKYEPFCRPVVKMFEKAGPYPVFDYGRHVLRGHAIRCFKRMTYDIEAYKRELEGKTVIVEAHPARFRVHGLRHVRLGDLINNYGFTLQEANQFTGYSMRSMGISGALERYASLDWRTYAHRLLKPYVAPSNSIGDKGVV